MKIIFNSAIEVLFCYSCMAEYIIVTTLIRGGNKKKAEMVSYRLISPDFG